MMVQKSNWRFSVLSLPNLFCLLDISNVCVCVCVQQQSYRHSIVALVSFYQFSRGQRCAWHSLNFLLYASKSFASTFVHTLFADFFSLCCVRSLIFETAHHRPWPPKFEYAVDTFDQLYPVGVTHQSRKVLLSEVNFPRFFERILHKVVYLDTVCSLRRQRGKAIIMVLRGTWVKT